VVAEVTCSTAVSKLADPPCQMFMVAAVENRTSTKDPTVPKLRPAVAVKMKGSPPAGENTLLFGKSAAPTFAFWIPPGDAAVRLGAWYVSRPAAEIAQEPPGKNATIWAVAVSMPQRVAVGVTPVNVVPVAVVPKAEMSDEVPSAKIAGVPAFVDEKRRLMIEPAGVGKPVPVTV